MTDEGGETETVQVKTRVPKYQRDEWKAEADRLDMSQSEFVRTMVQAGRSGLEDTESASGPSSPPEGDSGDASPRGDGFETRVEAALDRTGVMSWDELVAELSGNFEDRLESALEALQAADRVRYSGRDGGYVLVDDEQ